MVGFLSMFVYMRIKCVYLIPSYLYYALTKKICKETDKLNEI